MLGSALHQSESSESSALRLDNRKMKVWGGRAGEQGKQQLHWLSQIFPLKWWLNSLNFRPKSRTAGVKTGLKSPKELLERQINDLEGRVDTLNTELAQVMKTESEMNVIVDQMEQDKNVSEDRVDEVRQKLASAELQKDNLLKKVDYLEEEIEKKRKELNTLNN